MFLGTCSKSTVLQDAVFSANCFRGPMDSTDRMISYFLSSSLSLSLALLIWYSFHFSISHHFPPCFLYSCVSTIKQMVIMTNIRSDILHASQNAKISAAAALNAETRNLGRTHDSRSKGGARARGLWWWWFEFGWGKREMGKRERWGEYWKRLSRSPSLCTSVTISFWQCHKGLS